jgi:sugar phosphate permease
LKAGQDVSTHQKLQSGEPLERGSRVRDGQTTSHSGSEASPHNEANQFLTPFWVIFGLSMGPAIALGLARFAYALLLPSMRADLGWSFADAGAMNTANAAGYLVGALVAAPFGRRTSDKTAFSLGLFLTSAAIAGTGLTR